MSTSINGTYREGVIVLKEQPDGIEDETPVIVTFPDSSVIDLPARGINEAAAVELQAALATFEDWKCPKWTSTTITMPRKQNYKRGDVVLMLFPHSSLR
jgi:hypothetical protein